MKFNWKFVYLVGFFPKIRCLMSNKIFKQLHEPYESKSEHLLSPRKLFSPQVPETPAVSLSVPLHRILFNGILRTQNIYVSFIFRFTLFAGLEVIISIRPGNGPLPENHGFKTIQSFSEI